MLLGMSKVKDDRTVVAFSTIDGETASSWATVRYALCPSLREPGYGCVQSKPTMAVELMATGVWKAFVILPKVYETILLLFIKNSPLSR